MEIPAEISALIESPPIDPCGDFVLIRVQDVEQVSRGGIVLGTAKELSREQHGAAHGWIVATGPFAWADDEKPWAKRGDLVVFHRYEGVVPQLDGLDDGKFRIVNDNKILGVIR